MAIMINGRIYSTERVARYVVTHSCGHKDTLITKPSAARRRSLQAQICHNCWKHSR